jgi:hypothetical protein
MAGHPTRNLSVRYAVSQSGRAMCESLPRGSPTAIGSAASLTARLPSPHCKIMRGRRDNRRRFKCICRRTNRSNEILDRLLLFGWRLPLRNPLDLVCEGMMKKPQVCDHCGGRFGMVTYRWWGNKFCKRACKDAYLHEVARDRDKILRWYGLLREVSRSGFSLYGVSSQR